MNRGKQAVHLRPALHSRPGKADRVLRGLDMGHVGQNLARLRLREKEPVMAHQAEFRAARAYCSVIGLPRHLVDDIGIHALNTAMIVP